jgi:hypothetical protein
MKRTCWWAVGVGTVCYVLTLSTHVMPEFLCLIFSFALLIALFVIMLVALTVGFTRWRKSSRLWPLPALVCLAFIVCAYFAPLTGGQLISDWRFGRHLTEYSRVVDGLRNGTISCATPCNAKYGVVEVKDRPAHIKGIWEVRCDDGGIAVLFLINTDVPLLHAGYLFKDYGESSNCSTRLFMPEKRWPYVRHITRQWYHFSDQPGL